MKILIICPYFFEPHRWMISAYKTALYLSKTTKVVVLTTGLPRYEKVNKNLVVYRMRDIFLPDPINYSIVPELFFTLAKVIRKEKPTHFVVNKHMFFTSFCILWLKLKGKKVLTVTDTFPGINWFPTTRIVRYVMWLYARIIGLPLLRISDHVVLLHEGLIEYAQHYGLRYSVIHNGVDFAQIDRARPDSELRDKNYINILYVGRLESVKRYEDIYLVAKKMTRMHRNIRFVFVGSTKGKESWAKTVGNKQIIFLGHRSDVFSLMKTSDIFVLASQSEGLPNAVMEAMACRLPCVCSRVGGINILIKNNANGLLFEAGDLNKMQQQLQRLIDDKNLREQLGRRARATILRDFNWSKIADNYKTLLTSL